MFEITQIREADDVIFCLALLDQSYTGNDFDAKALCEERALLGIDLAEFRFEVLGGQDSQVLVDDLAAFCCVTIKVANDVLRFL